MTSAQLPSPSQQPLKCSEPRTSVSIDGIPYSIDPLKIPYFRSYIEFQTSAGQSFDHKSIPYFDAAFVGIEEGYRHCFRRLPTNLEACHDICDTFDFLCVDVLNGSSLDDTIQRLKCGKGQFDVEYKRAVFVNGDKAAARDAAFLLVYQLLKGTFDDEIKDSVKVFNVVKYIVSHRAVFKYAARKLVRESYEERFCTSPKQNAELNRWPILEPGTGGFDESGDVTTDASISDDWDEDY